MRREGLAPEPGCARRDPSASRSPMPSRAPISSIARRSASASPKRSQPATPAPWPRRSSRRSRSCPDRARRSGRSPPGPHRDRHGDERAEGEHALVLHARLAPALVAMMRSQPIEHEAQLSRTAARSSSSSVVVSVPKLWLGSAESALNDSRFASVPRSRYFAVAGPNERARRSLRPSAPPPDRRGAAGRSPHGDGLELLGAQDGAEAAAARVAAVMGDRRVAHEPLAGGPDRGDAVRGPEPLAQPGLGLRRRQAPQVAGVDPRAPSPSTISADGSRTRRARRSRRCR